MRMSIINVREHPQKFRRLFRDPELGPDDSNPGDLLRLSLRTVTQFCRDREIPSQVYTEVCVKVRCSHT